jgi:thiosulfate/3-mercaptopyruvate sulfurtransferase
MLKIPNVIVNCKWLHEHLNHPDLVVLDATIPKVTANAEQTSDQEYIPFARFFDIKKTFSDRNAEFPNTLLSANHFQLRAQELGINNNSCIVVYDQLGIYSSPRAWYMFRAMGFDNIAVLNGGLPEWKEQGFEVVGSIESNFSKGDFTTNPQEESFVDAHFVLNSLENQQYQILDARSAGRFKGEAPEPRKGVKGGHIPTSHSLPYSSLLQGNTLKTTEKLQELFHSSNKGQKPMIFSCGTGITACVLALGAAIAGYQNVQVYDGSWTEWGSLPNVPIEV